MTDRPRRPSRRAVAIGAVLVLLVTAVVTWALTRPDAEVVPGAAPTPSPSPTEAAGLPSPSPSPEDLGPDDDGTPSAAPEEPAPGDEPAPDQTDQMDETDPSLPPVALDEPAPFGTEVTARLASVEAVQGEADGPGEIAGPALRVTVELTNATGSAVALSTTVVNAYAGPDLEPLEPLSGPGARWFDGELAAGGTVSGVYVFNAPVDLRDHLRVTVSYDPEVPTVVLEGAAPRG